MMNKGHQLRQDPPGLLTKVPRKAPGWDAMCAIHNGCVGEGRSDKPSCFMAYMFSPMRKVFSEKILCAFRILCYSKSSV